MELDGTKDTKQLGQEEGKKCNELDLKKSSQKEELKKELDLVSSPGARVSQ